MFKKIILPIILALFVFFGGAAGFYVWAKNNQVTIPFLEVEPEEAMANMYKAMAGISTLEHDSDIQMKTRVDLEKLALAGKRKIAQGLVYLRDNQPQVLGISNIEEQDSEDKPEQLPSGTVGSEPSDISPLSFLEKKKLEISASYALSGKMDVTNPGRRKSLVNIDTEFGFNNTSFGIDINAATDGRDVYFKVGSLPPPLSMITDQADEMTDRWWRINPDKLKEMKSDFKDSEIGGLLEADELIFATDRLERIEQDIRSAASKHNLLQIDERLPDEMMQNRKCYHYRVSLNRDSLAGFVQDVYVFLSEEMGAESPMAMTGFTNDQDFQEAIDKFAQAISIAQGEVWIDKENFYLYRVLFNFELDPGGIEFNGETMPAGALKAEISGETNYSRINQPMEIEMPENPEDLNDFLENQMAEARLKARDARVVADVKQLQTALELYYYDHNQYPPDIYGNDFKYYMSEIPEPQVISGLSVCQENDKYIYNTNNPEYSYSIEYCLIQDVAIGSAGKNIATNYDVSVKTISKDQDYDQDGLMDYEEVMIYNSNPRDNDSDNDGYSDGDEVENGYNPAGPGKLPEKIKVQSQVLD
jgi:hypothetical protein